MTDLTPAASAAGITIKSLWQVSELARLLGDLRWFRESLI